ncbi:MAG: hypothetical protein M0Q91_05585 [Methanoregula sp.]|jgi:hypothetical protein|nr:hypothetical protein [Methanoregula sp.]
MDADKKKKFISAMLLYCLAGDLGVRINYGGILISRVEDYLINEVVLKDPEHSYLVRILAAVDKTVESALITKSKVLSPEDLSEIKKIVVEKTFPIDESWTTKDALGGITSLGDLSDTRIARSYFYSASDHYPASAQSATAAAEAIKNMDRAMQKIVDICDHYDLIEFGADEWRENVVGNKREDENVR